MRSHFIGELSESMDGERVIIAGWVHEIRELSRVKFVILRDSTGIVQAVVKKDDGELAKKTAVPKESVVEAIGTVKANKTAKKGFEIVLEDFENLNPISATIPFEVTGKVPAEIDTRLNHRHIDLRRLETSAIFKIESTVLNAFTEHFRSMKFTQIRPPCIIAEASEGGTDLFPIAYFEKNAYLAQSPQLYKQLAIVGGMDRVVMAVPVFRAEKSNTVYHINEITQMDIEVGFIGMDEAIKLLVDAFIHIIKTVKAERSEELALLGAELNIPEVKIVDYADAIKELQKGGHRIEYGHDFSREHETGLYKAYGDAVVIKRFPRNIRAFYSMPSPDDPELTESFDLIYRGLEICSGAQRIHMPDLLIESMRRHKIDPKNFDFYINAFRCGAPPHAGWSIGLERLTMQITRAQNIRECSMFPRDRKRLTP